MPAHVEGGLSKMHLGFTHAPHVRQIDAVQALLLKHLTKQTGVAGVILHEEKDFDRFLRHSIFPWFGSLTPVSQKSLMLFTRASNSFSCTGLLR